MVYLLLSVALLSEGLIATLALGDVLTFFWQDDASKENNISERGFSAKSKRVPKTLEGVSVQAGTPIFI